MSKLSIVIVTYNHEEMILNCLDSLLSSDNHDVELVIADDCSTDNTYFYIKQWTNSHINYFENIVVLRQESNKGTVRNLIDAINESSAGFIKSIGGDDWFLDHAIDKIKNFIDKNEFDIAFSPLRVAYQNQNGTVHMSPDEIIPASRVNDFFCYDCKRQFQALTRWDCLPAPGALYTRRYWEIIKLEKQNYLTIAEDWAMWILGTLNNMKFVEIHEPLVVYRKHEKSVSREISPRQKQGLQEVSTMLWRLGFSRPEWLTINDKLRLFLLCLSIKVVSLMPLKVIKIIDKVRRNLGAVIYKRKF